MNQAKEKEVTDMFNDISKTYDQVNSILSFGIHHAWKKKLLSFIPQKNSCSLLDVASGTGDILLRALESKKVSTGIGLDLAENMLKIGEEKAKKLQLQKQAKFEVGNALDLPYSSQSFDCYTCSFGIRNVQNPLKALQEAYRVLKPSGRVLILEFSLPENKLLKSLHLLYLRSILPKIGGFFSKSPQSYLYLNQTIESFPYGEAFLKLLKEAHFQQTKAYPLLGGISTLYCGEKQ